MIWRLTYCNKKGVEARIDVIKGNRTPVEIVQGSGQPFTLSYKLDKNDKSGHIMTSSADIEIFETETFNIDDLKTSNETELKVEYFEENILTWSGFILPDFFSREIGSPNIVRMTASDRLTALKGVTLSDLPSRVSLRNLIGLILAKTGLSLALASQIQINQGSTNILDSEVLSQRFTDVKGRSISCYDILLSIMVGTNSTIRQRAGQWQIYNKLEHELRTPTIFFDKVERGAIRTIQPVASSVGVYQEYGGGRLHPDNYDFAQGGSGWVNKNGFSYTISNQKPVSYSVGVPNHTVTFGESDRNRMMIMGIVLPFWKPDTAPHVENKFPVITSNEDSVKITIDISVLGWGYWGSGSTGRFIILAENDNSRLAFNPNSGHFEEFDNQAISPNSSEPPYVIKLRPSANKVGDTFPITSKSVKYETVLEKANLSDYTISIRIYRTSGFTGPTAPLFINFANIRFSNTEEAPRGTLFKTTQGSNFTKLHDVETTIFGDYITSGLNGYFYNYSIDDTSSLYLPNGTLSPPQWVTAFDTTERPLLHHISRQKSRLFSVAHDILKANINVDSFDPLAVFQDCKGGKYVIVSASFDFLRSEVDVELEQIAYDNTILKRDFIYSYFGEGEDTIKSIGGIAGGGGGTGGGGGGMTSSQLEMLTNLADWWKLDEENDAIYSEKSVYSLKGVSALGLGSEGGGGGGDFDRLDAWEDYNATKAGWVLSALLGKDLDTRTKANLASILELNTRVDDLQSGSATNIEISGSGNAVTGVSKSGNTLTFAKGSTFALSTHNHDIANITGLQDALDGKEPSFTKNTAFNKNFGTAVGTVAQGNDSRIINGQIAFEWGNHASVGYALNSALTAHTGNATVHITSDERTNWNDANSKKHTHSNKATLDGITPALVTNWNTAYTNTHTHSNKALLDLITQSNIDVLAKLSIVDGNIKVDTTLWATGGISALGLGEGGGSGGGGVDMLDSWANYTPAKASFYVPANLLVPFRNDTLNRLTSLESGSATSITTTGSGNAITSLTKSGSVITANKGLTFALASHTHTIAQITGLQGALNLKASQSDISTAIDGIEIGGRNLLLNSTKKLENGSVILGSYNFVNDMVKYQGSILTISFDAELGEGRSGFTIRNTSGAYQLTEVREEDRGADGRFRKSFSFPGRSEGNNSIRIDNYPSGAGPASWVTNIKLEKGNKATDWTPALEDLVSDWSESNASSFSFIKNKPTQLSQFIDNIGVASHIANKANPHAVTTAQIGAVDLTTNQTIGGVKTFTDDTFFTKNIILGQSLNSYIHFSEIINGDGFSILYDGAGSADNNFLHITGGVGSVGNQTKHITVRRDSGNVGIGTTNPLYKLDVAGTGRFTGSVTAPTFIGALSGNASSATKLQTARNINGTSFNGSANITTANWGTSRTLSFTGDVTGSSSVNGSKNVATAMTLANSGVTAGTYRSVTVDAKGRVTAGTNPTTVSGYGLTDAVTTNTTQTITGAKTFSTLLTASAGVNTPKVDFGNGFTIEPSGTELVFKYNGVIKQRMLSNGTILATGGITALTTT